MKSRSGSWSELHFQVPALLISTKNKVLPQKSNLWKSKIHQTNRFCKSGHQNHFNDKMLALVYRWTSYNQNQPQAKEFPPLSHGSFTFWDFCCHGFHLPTLKANSIILVSHIMSLATENYHLVLIKYSGFHSKIPRNINFSRILISKKICFKNNLRYFVQKSQF